MINENTFDIILQCIFFYEKIYFQEIQCCQIFGKIY